jgi:hypothetical protein
MKNIIFGILAILVVICIFIQVDRAHPKPFCPTITGECPPEMLK